MVVLAGAEESPGEPWSICSSCRAPHALTGRPLLVLLLDYPAPWLAWC